MRAVIHIRSLSLLILGGLLSACHRASRLEGDVYFAGSNGATQKASGVTVYLLRGEDAVMAQLDRACAAYGAFEQRMNRLSQAVALPSSFEEAQRTGAVNKYFKQFNAAQDSIKAVRPSVYHQADSVLRTFIVDSAKTGFDAHYVFPDLAPGRYVLWTEYSAGDAYRSWLARVDVHPGSKLSTDLNYRSNAGSVVHCYMTPRDTIGAAP